jgi:hypothetical protein
MKKMEYLQKYYLSKNVIMMNRLKINLRRNNMIVPMQLDENSMLKEDKYYLIKSIIASRNFDIDDITKIIKDCVTPAGIEILIRKFKEK